MNVINQNKHCGLRFKKNSRITRWTNMIAGYYGYPVYIVGSTLTKENPRDLDLVCIIPDYDFELRYDCKLREWINGFIMGSYSDEHWRWANECLKRSINGMKWTRKLTDFKVYPKSYDEEYMDHLPKLRTDSRPNYL